MGAYTHGKDFEGELEGVGLGGVGNEVGVRGKLEGVVVLIAGNVHAKEAGWFKLRRGPFSESDLHTT